MGERVDEIIYLQQLSIGAGASNFGVLEEDWNTLNSKDADWLVLTGEEDWGFNVVDFGNYTLKINSSFDGESSL